MATESVEVLIEGGKATAAPPLGPALGPLGVNIGQVVAEINKKTQDYKGMQVPVTVKVDPQTKAFTIEIGTPPASALIKKEAGVQKGAHNPATEKVADLKIEQVIKIAKMKESALLGKDLKSKVREIVGTCQSMGILVEGVSAGEAFKQLDEGRFDEEIKAEKTEISAEEQKELAAEKQRLAEELKKRHEEFMAKAKAILEEQKDKEANVKRKAMRDAGVPDEIIHELVPEEKEAKKK